MSQEQHHHDEVARKLLAGVDLSGLDGMKSDEAIVPVTVLVLSQVVYEAFQNQTRYLQANGVGTAVILLGKKTNNQVNALDGVFVETGDRERSVTDEDILGKMEYCRGACHEAGDEIEIVGVMLAQKRTPDAIEALMAKEKSFQVVMAGIPIVRRDLRTQVVQQGIAIEIYTPCPTGGIQRVHEFDVQYLQP